MQENQAIINYVGILLQKIAFLEKRIVYLREKSGWSERTSGQQIGVFSPSG
jgi:hypothetical protein